MLGNYPGIFIYLFREINDALKKWRSLVTFFLGSMEKFPHTIYEK